MTTPAWSALADRFAALATEQEFRFTTHPFNTAGAFQDDADRFRFAYPFGGTPSAPESLGIVTGSGPFKRGEIVRINQLRWLSWAAGLLFCRDASVPAEAHWWRACWEAFRDRTETTEGDRVTLSGVARLSAELARQFAASNRLTPPPAGTKVDNWPTIQADFRVLRDRFNAERWHTARPDVALVSFPDQTTFDYWKRTTIDAAMPGPTEPRAWASHGTVWGDPEPVEAFVNLAKDAGTALPLELSFVPPLFPWFNCISNTHPAPQTSWLEFLFLISPASFTLQEDTPVSTSRVARLTTSAFITAVAAIDRLLSLDAPAFLRQFRENAVHCNPWLGEADRAAALLAVAASGQTHKPNREDAPKSPHWTEYPERVETFGDLSSVLETFDRHEMETGFTAESFKNGRGRATAYTVDSHLRKFRLNPCLDRMPGLERLLDRFDIDGHYTLTLNQFRELRKRAVNALRNTRAAVDAMTFTAVADALDAAERPPAPPPTSNSPAGGIRTFGEFLADVRGVELAAAHTRADADAMGGDPGSGYLRMQAGVFEATAAYREHPSFPFLEAHVNQHYGPFTHANLFRVRGEICAVRHCGTTEADQLPVEEIVTTLGCPGAPVVNPARTATTPRQVSTRPASVEPPQQFTHAPLSALPSALNNAPQPHGVHDPAGRRGASYTILRQSLEQAGHSRDSVEWAIHRHIEAGRLEAEPGVTSLPNVYRDGGWVINPVTNPTYERERCVLWATPALWEWWRALQAQSEPSRSNLVHASMFAELPSPFTVPEPTWTLGEECWSSHE